MKVISFAAQKGGVGKTLMTASLAALAQQDCEREEGEAGKGKVAICDLDPQGSLTAWYNARQRDGPILIDPIPAIYAFRFQSLRRRGVRYLFIDTPPGISEYIARALNAAHLTVIPVRPGELDFAATGRTLRAVTRGKVPFALLPNAGIFRSRAMGELIRRLNDAGMPTLPPVHHRVNLVPSGGLTLPETDSNSAGTHELRNVWTQIRARLGE